MNVITQIILLVLSILTFFFFTNPHYKNVEDLKSQSSAYEAALEKAKEADTIKQDLISKYNTFSADDLSNLQKLLPDTVDNIRLLLDINKVAATYGSTISGIQVATTAPTPTTATAADRPYGSVVIQFSVAMTYNNFIRFIGDMEHNLRLTDVTALSFTGTDGGVYNYGVTLRTYWLK